MDPLFSWTKINLTVSVSLLAAATATIDLLAINSLFCLVDFGLFWKLEWQDSFFNKTNNKKIILEWTLINAEPGLFSYFHCNEFENHDFKSEIVSKTLNLNLALYICNSVNLTPLKIIAWRSTVTKYILKTFYHSRVWKFDPQQPLVWWSDI